VHIRQPFLRQPNVQSFRPAGSPATHMVHVGQMRVLEMTYCVNSVIECAERTLVHGYCDLKLPMWLVLQHSCLRIYRYESLYLTTHVRSLVLAAAYTAHSPLWNLSVPVRCVARVARVGPLPELRLHFQTAYPA
jgi:hypothetical protein